MTWIVGLVLFQLVWCPGWASVWVYQGKCHLSACDPSLTAIPSPWTHALLPPTPSPGRVQLLPAYGLSCYSFSLALSCCKQSRSSAWDPGSHGAAERGVNPGGWCEPGCFCASSPVAAWEGPGRAPCPHTARGGGCSQSVLGASALPPGLP